jgi:hypothetical protein
VLFNKDFAAFPHVEQPPEGFLDFLDTPFCICQNKRLLRGGMLKKGWKNFDITLNKSKTLYQNFCQFDAVFISTKGQKLRLADQLAHLTELNISEYLFIVPSKTDDVPSKLPALCSSLLNQFLTYKENHGFGNICWDLPFKRNFVIEFSKVRKYEKVLLIDDDIRFTDKRIIYSMVDALNVFWISSCYSTETIDTSLVGEVAIKCGVERINFLSGNCLAINLHFFIPYFPNIYNEDWLAVIPAIIAKTAILIGPVIQLGRNIEAPEEMAAFQEFGELIADEIYDHISNNLDIKDVNKLFDVILNEALWEKAIVDRYKWLNCLLTFNHNGDTKLVINGAICALKNISSEKCLGFLYEWKQKIFELKGFIQ